MRHLIISSVQQEVLARGPQLRATVVVEMGPEDVDSEVVGTVVERVVEGVVVDSGRFSFICNLKSSIIHIALGFHHTGTTSFRVISVPDKYQSETFYHAF